jgi:hypothetical protein
METNKASKTVVTNLEQKSHLSSQLVDNLDDLEQRLTPPGYNINNVLQCNGQIKGI